MALVSRRAHLVWTVAPFAGAWIEIAPPTRPRLATRVAPFAGAWIEMCLLDTHGNDVHRRSLRGSVD